MIDNIEFARWFRANTVRNAVYLQGRASEADCWPSHADFLRHRARELLEFAESIDSWIAMKSRGAV